MDLVIVETQSVGRLNTCYFKAHMTIKYVLYTNELDGGRSLIVY